MGVKITVLDSAILFLESRTAAVVLVLTSFDKTRSHDEARSS